MRNGRDKREESKIGKGDDTYSRAFFGTPTWGGLIVILVIVLYFVFR